jgi:hypothetical protein
MKNSGNPMPRNSTIIKNNTAKPDSIVPMSPSQNPSFASISPATGDRPRRISSSSCFASIMAGIPERNPNITIDKIPNISAIIDFALALCGI